MAKPTRLEAALVEDSPLRDAVRPGLNALATDDVQLIAGDQRHRVGDSLDLDTATRDYDPQANRWDYIVSVPDVALFAGIEPHTAKDSEIRVVVAKRNHAQQVLRAHLRDGCRVTRWFWVTHGKVSFSKMDKARRRLDQNGIQFVGRMLRTFG